MTGNKSRYKHPGAASELSITEKNAFIVRVYRILIYSLLFSGTCAFIGVVLDLPFSWWWLGAELIAFLVCIVFKAHASLLYLWSGMSGLTMAPLLSDLIAKGNEHVVWIAIFTATLLFVGLSLYVHYTNKSFSHWKGILFAALVLLILGTLLLLLFPGLINEVVWSAISIIIFMAYILFDTSSIIEEYGPGEEANAAMSLHLDFIILFTDLLRLIKRSLHKTGNETAENAITDHDGDLPDLMD